MNRKLLLQPFFWMIAFSLGLRFLFVASNELIPEEAYYWNYAQHLDFGYLDHPPMVAVLIKISTLLLGSTEFSVRLFSILCYLGMAFFSFELSHAMRRGSGAMALMLVSILPYFFLESLVMTPDAPLLLCWSAGLYYFYRALIIEEGSAWYLAGIWLGLGMLSKYTIVFLGLSAFLYVILIPHARKWLGRREPYLAALISLILFTPVIYWNATHQWISFAFQGNQRFAYAKEFSLHELAGLLVFFLLPAGLYGLTLLPRRTGIQLTGLSLHCLRFIQVFTAVPLLFFAFYSLSHPLQFNWIGPGLLALIPWLAALAMHENAPFLSSSRNWYLTATGLLCVYATCMWVILQGTPKPVYQAFFNKYIAWSELTQSLHQLAKDVEREQHTPVTLVTLDRYNLASQLSFYQVKAKNQGKIDKVYPLIGSHLFHEESLMYRYWTKKEDASDKTLILVSPDLFLLEMPVVKTSIVENTPIRTILAQDQGGVRGKRAYYYQVVRLK